MSVDQFPAAAAQLTGIICEGVFYGSYLVSCWFCARTLLLTDSNQGVHLVPLGKVRWLFATISMMFFVISTWDMATGILHLFNAFITAEDPAVEFNKPEDWLNIARALNQGLVILLGDFVLIYRCWVVYGKRWLVITPSLILYLGAIAMTIRVMEIEVNPQADKTAIYPWSGTIFGINAVQNILTSGMLVWRIWRIGRLIDENTSYPGGYETTPPRPMQKFMRAIAESGAVYTTIVFATFLVSASGSNAVFITADMSLQAAGIVFNVIIVRSIERNNQELCVGVADPENGQVIPTFRHAVGDASVEYNQSLEPKKSPFAPV